jgi:hypothetical protein
MMRFAIKGAGFFETSEHELGRRFFVENVSRLQHAIDFIAGTPSQLKQQVETERKGWNLFYDVLDHIEIALTQQNEAAILMQQKTKEIIDHTKICIE